MEEIKTEDKKIEEILFVAVKEEPLDEDSLPECPPFKDEFKHEETEITDVQVDTQLEDENLKQEEAASTVKSSFSNTFSKTIESTEGVTQTNSSLPQDSIKQECEDPLEEDGSDTMDDDLSEPMEDADAETMAYSCIICNDCFVTTKDLNEHTKSVHNFSCCEYCLEHLGRYSCSFKGIACTHDYKEAEATDASEVA